MKILFTRFPLESAHGGAEIQTMSLMKGLTKRGHGVAFMGSCPTLLVMCDQHRIPHMDLDIGPPPVTKSAAATFVVRQSKMARRLEETFEAFSSRKLDAVFMLSLSEKLLLTPIALKAGVQVFWIEHDSVGPWLTKSPYLSKLKELSALVTTVCVSELSRQLYIDLGWKPETVVAVPNGIDADRFAMDEEDEAELTAKLAEKNDSDPISIGTVARLDKEKGLDVLIECMPALPGATLTIIGTGKEEAALKRLIEKLYLTDRVNIKSRMGKLNEFYRLLDVFVLPSRTNDPFGLVAAEAMYCGTPTIVTNACGISHELENGTDAVVVQANSVATLHDAISALMQDGSKRQEIGLNGQKKALEEFTTERMIDRYEALVS